MRKLNKTAKNTKKLLKLDAEILFYIIIMAMLPVFIAALYVQFEKIDNLRKNAYLIENIDKIIIRTDKEIYKFPEKIVLAIENHSNRSIYSQPCEYLNNFEKYIDGKWVNSGTKPEKIEYDRSGFNLSKKIAKCTLPLPDNEGDGVYRFVVKVYHGCQEPEKCTGSIDFYSNEFRVERTSSEQISNN